MSSKLDLQASSDQKTTQILLQTSNDISPRNGTTEMDPSMPDAIITGSALVLPLVTGSSTKPADFRNIGYGSNLPVIIRRLQRDFKRAVLETKIGFYTTITRDIMARGKTYSDSSNWTEIRFYFLEILEGLHVL